MPRNSSGTYALPAGNPVQPNTLIETSWANPTMSDIGQALTDSLDRYGRGNMLAALKINDGLVTAPGMSFGSEPSTGLFRPASGEIGMAVLGVLAMKWTVDGVEFPKPIISPLIESPLKLTHDTLPTLNFGTAALPTKGSIAYDVATEALQFGSNSVVNHMALDSLGRLIVGGGVSRLVANLGMFLQVEGTGTAAGAAFTRDSASNAGPVVAFGKTRGAALGDVTAINSGDALGSLQWAGADGVNLVTASAQLLVTATEAFSATNHGAQMSFLTRAAGSGGALAARLVLSEAGISAGTSQFLANAADTLAAPGFSWTGDTNKGFWSPGTDRIGVVVNGGQTWEFVSGGGLVNGDSTVVPPVFGVAGKFAITGSNTNGSASANVMRFSTNTTGPALNFAKSRTSYPGLGAVASGDTLGTVNFVGADGTVFADASVQIHAKAAEAFTTTAKGGTLDFLLAPTGSNVLASVLLLDSPTSTFSTQLAVGGSNIAAALAVREAGAYGGSGPNTNANTIVAEGNGHIGISLLSPNTTTARIYFGDPENSAIGQITYNHTNDNLNIAAGGSTSLAISAASVSVVGAELILADVTPTVNLSAGFRAIPSIGNTATATKAAVGKVYKNTAAITVNTGVFAADDVFAVYNNSAAAFNITQGAGVTLRLAGSATTGTRSLAARGWASIFAVSATEFVVSGSGVS